MSRIPIAVQLFSVKNEFTADPKGILKAVADMGYEGVEFWATPTKYDPAELRSYLDEFNLQCCGWHTPAKWFQEENIETLVQFNNTLGNKLLVSWMPPEINRETLQTVDDWKQVSDFCNAAQKKLAPHGFRVGYHNHETEFISSENTTPWDVIFSNTDPEVHMQLDTGNGLMGGCDAPAVLKKFGDKAVTVHLKPYKKVAEGEDAHTGYRPLIGEDDVPWKEVIDICNANETTKWYIIEYESDAHPPMEAIELCLRNFKTLLNES